MVFNNPKKNKENFISPFIEKKLGLEIPVFGLLLCSGRLFNWFFWQHFM